MGTILDQYKLVIEGKLSESQFLRNVRLALPQFITNVNSYKDTVKILKNKGIISEVKDEKINEYNPQQYNLGMRYELSKGTDSEKADKIIKKNLASNSAYYTNLHLAGYNEEAMKTNNKKRTDLPIEVKKDNFVDTANGVKKVKVDKLTEGELRILINKILTESLEGSSKSISIKNLTYEKAAKIAGRSDFNIEKNSGSSNTKYVMDSKRFEFWKEDLLDGDENKTLTYNSKSGRGGTFEFSKPDKEKRDTMDKSVSNVLSKRKD
jgi:hypothetical protein